MLMVNAQLRKEGTGAASRIAARYLRHKEQLVQQVWKEFVDKDTTTTKPQASPDVFLRTRLPLTTTLAQIIQEFVRQRRQSRQRTVAKDVASFLWSQYRLDFGPESESSTLAAYRTTQRALSKLGYKRGKKKEV
ncbi:hypothetical protein DYB38_011239 [Aphanomyces astaci]|uniref:Uncharacterized protein n=1 Tax=Aphanomyces astaci TaxID=112090 RepID=A0A397BLK3_APHAT|nr:hypothetical protein DYB36_011363 [Aphanomyces astaci]RHY49304.1 hypothetical protein DYB34_010328 [Aphanomyces astaci]RHY56013.1 hypothetical protein DYB38_011239 [Aphanomyces astaci]